MESSIEQYRGLDAELYDTDYADYPTDDIQFYVEEAVGCGSPLLELGCGTGRITIPIARAGIPVTGIDISMDMLEIATRKISRLQPDIAGRIELLQGDMRDFQLDRTFDLVIIPFRAFICLLTVEHQKQALLNVRRHITPGGRLILNFYDPNLREILDYEEKRRSVQQLMNRFKHPVSGNQVSEWSNWIYDLTEQTVEEVRNYIEEDAEGTIVSSTVVKLRVRYLYRWEMHHLLELCGYRVEQLYSDFKRKPFRARGEQIWVASPVET
jgi:ubiquinone/menaquinone biosynthesis C-methylase UbiE